MKNTNLFTKGNNKISNKCLVFAIHTNSCLCVLSEKCKECYAVKCEKLFKNAWVKWQWNYKQTKDKYFIPKAIQEIQTSKRNMVRVHSAGEFYSDEYISKWESIAKALPDVQFYSYTKNPKAFRLNSLENFNMIASLAPSPTGFNFGTIKELQYLVNNGWFLCPDQQAHNGKLKEKDKICMKKCFACLKKQKVCFVKH